jgi:hypothetical protein
MEDVLRRLGSLEKDVSVIKTEIAGITAVLPTFATKEDVALLRADVSQLPYMAANMAMKADVRAEVADAKTSLIQWMVGTAIAMTALAFTIGKFVH